MHKLDIIVHGPSCPGLIFYQGMLKVFLLPTIYTHMVTHGPIDQANRKVRGARAQR